MRLSFDADHLRSLLEFSRAGTQRVPTFEQVLDPALWSDDLPDARIALLEAEIAERMGLSSHTVHDYARKLYRKFNVKGRVGLMALVLAC